MCFSFEVSLGTGLMTWAIVFYLLFTRKLTIIQKNKLIFLLIFSSMQYIDAILWYIKMEKNKINYFVTSVLIPIILSAQIIFNIYFRNKLNNFYINLIVVFMIVYMFRKFNGYSVPICSNKLSSPLWGNKEIRLYELLIFSFMVFYPGLCGVFIVPLLVLFIGGSYGSLWCAISNISALYYLFKF